MPDTNVKLSKEEMMLVNDRQFILTKQIIISKVYKLFGLLNEEYKLVIKNKKLLLKDEVLRPPAKIYKGEQYLQLPYVLMDYPRCFAKTDVFAIRSFFWWGNFFSITIHLAGIHLEEYKEYIFLFIEQQKNSGWYICINDTEWQHDFGEQNYLPVYACMQDANLMKTIRGKPFIKLAKKIELAEWNNVHEFFIQNFSALTEMLAHINFQGDERVP